MIKFTCTFMELRIQRIDQSLPMPSYATAGSVAFDLYAREAMTVEPGTVALIPCNLRVAIPDGYVLLISSRSSTGRKKGLHVPLGVIDQDFRGPEDEMRIQAWNLSSVPTVVERGERIAQALVMPIERCALVEEAWEMAAEAGSRGGFGSTG